MMRFSHHHVLIVPILLALETEGCDLCGCADARASSAVHFEEHLQQQQLTTLRDSHPPVVRAAVAYGARGDPGCCIASESFSFASCAKRVNADEVVLAAMAAAAACTHAVANQKQMIWQPGD